MSILQAAHGGSLVDLWDSLPEVSFGVMVVEVEEVPAKALDISRVKITKLNIFCIMMLLMQTDPL